MKVLHERNNILGTNRDICCSTCYVKKIVEHLNTEKIKNINLPAYLRNLSWTCSKNK